MVFSRCLRSKWLKNEYWVKKTKDPVFPPTIVVGFWVAQMARPLYFCVCVCVCVCVWGGGGGKIFFKK